MFDCRASPFDYTISLTIFVAGLLILNTGIFIIFFCNNVPTPISKNEVPSKLCSTW